MTAKELYAYAREVTVQVHAKTASGDISSGSGVWVSRAGYVATCFHVVKDSSDGQITVGIGGATYIDFEHHNVVNGAFRNHKAKLVASDPETDVAILEVADNPFLSPPAVLIQSPTAKITAPVQAARLSDEIPSAGEEAIVTGYPLVGTDFVMQKGNVAGVGFPNRTNDPVKGARVYLSIVANPSNSGGPVLGDDGRLLGLQEGYLGAPVRDEANRDVYYYRPKRDAQGQVVRGADGQPETEIAKLTQNSGISFAVPTRFVVSLLHTVEKTSK
jgi:S1-C subfamily serine protease